MNPVRNNETKSMQNTMLKNNKKSAALKLNHSRLFLMTYF